MEASSPVLKDENHETEQEEELDRLDEETVLPEDTGNTTEA